MGKAALAGKHVLVEKPVGVSLAEAQGMAAACAEAGVLLMDGVMFMHHERLRRMAAVLGVPAPPPLPPPAPGAIEAVENVAVEGGWR